MVVVEPITTNKHTFGFKGFVVVVVFKGMSPLDRLLMLPVTSAGVLVARAI